MWDFKFDAPQYCNFYRKQKKNSRIQIDPNNPDDMWFMQQHIQLTPVKEQKKQQCAIKQQKIIQNKKAFQLDQRKINHSEPIKIFSKNVKLQNIQCKIKQSKKIVCQPIAQRIKRMHINEKYNIFEQQHLKNNSRQHKLSKQSIKSINTENNHINIKKQKYISKTKSEAIVNENSKIRRPCPYPIKIQRDWQAKSHRSWYSLSQKSAKKAIDSMEKFNKNRKKTSITANQKPMRFKF